MGGSEKAMEHGGRVAARLISALVFGAVVVMITLAVGATVCAILVSRMVQAAGRWLTARPAAAAPPVMNVQTSSSTGAFPANNGVNAVTMPM